MCRWSLALLLLAACSFRLDGQMITGQGRMEAFVDDLAQAHCEIMTTCFDEPQASCEVRVRAGFGGSLDRCRLDRRSADQCLQALGQDDCRSGGQLPDACFNAVERCDVFFGMEPGFDTGFDRG